MSSFLVNLARRGAGLPAATVQAPPLSPFGPEIHAHGDELVAEAPVAAREQRVTEESATGNVSGQAPARSSAPAGLPSTAPTHSTPSMQRLSVTEPGTPAGSTSAGSTSAESAAAPGTPPPGPAPAPRQHVIPYRREAAVTPMERPEPLAFTVSPFHADRKGVTESDGKSDRPVAEAPLHASTREHGEAPVLAPRQQPPGRPRNWSPQTREPALPVPTIRPALHESPMLLQSPKATPASTPTPSSQLPIHVRIGRVEVRAPTEPTPPPAAPAPPAPLGFDGYYRTRNYRG
jgi:hypothetical protein